jgi:hypothetical protein
MKKYTILFALLTGMILLAFEAVPALQASAQCIGTNGQPYVCAPPGSSGGSEKPGPKNHPTTEPTKAPTNVPSVMFGPKPPPIVMGGPKPTPYPYVIPHIPSQNLCQIGPCWPFGIQPGDPVEYLAGGGFLAFLVVIGFVLLRNGHSTPGGEGGSIK